VLSGVGKLLHLIMWSRPEVYNAAKDLSSFMTAGGNHSSHESNGLHNGLLSHFRYNGVAVVS